MSSNGLPSREAPVSSDSASADEAPLTRWKKFRLVVKVVELRLRFVALMAITGLVFAYWDTLWNRYDKWMRPAAEQHAAVSGIEYYCPMHPQVVQDEPGGCPICGMPLANGRRARRPRCPRGSLPACSSPRPASQQAGIRTAEVGYAPLAETLTTVGYVAFDERRLARIVSKVPGKSRVEKLYVNFTGQDVKAGEPLAELYSPELYQAIQELLTASRRAEPDATRVQTAVGRSLLGDRARPGPAVGREAQAVGDHAGPDRRDPQGGPGRVHDPDPLADRRHMSSRRTSSRGRRSRGLPDVRDRRPAHASGSRRRSTSIRWDWSARGRRSRRPSRRFPARSSRARSSSSSRSSTRRPGPSRSATTWTTRAIASGPGCSPRSP